MSILVLGGGQMGSQIAKDLVKHGYEAAVADARDLTIDGVKTVQADLSSTRELLDLMVGDYDLVIGALPAKLGFRAMDCGITCGKDYVDLSYCPENVLWLDGKASSLGKLIVPDAGIAPGISNLISGRAIFTGHDHVKVYVGGVSKDENAPLGYAVSWSTEDLLDEYIRPARIVSDGREVIVSALSGVERIYVPGAGGFDAFCTDGLRTMLFYRPEELEKRKVTLVEKTMRREGHMDEMKKLIDDGKLVEYIESNCVGLTDMLVMRFDTGNTIVDLVVNGDDQMSAMARTTALSCSAFAQLVLEGRVQGAGVIPPEVIAEDTDTYKYLLDKLEDNGMVFNIKYPFA